MGPPFTTVVVAANTAEHYRFVSGRDAPDAMRRFRDLSLNAESEG
jgi:hypothetical protein